MAAAYSVANFSAFVTSIQERISRQAGKSPETTGVVAALVLVIVFPLLLALVGRDLRLQAIDPPEMAVSESVAPTTRAERPAASTGQTSDLPRALTQLGEPFVERFDGGVLDEHRWSISDGWSNGDWMENDWRRSQVRLAPESLRLALAPGPEGSDKPFASGEIRTNAEFRYGYFEARMRVPRDAGLVAGFFTYAGADDRARPNEIDIEILGRATSRVELTIHQNGRPTSKIVKLPFDAADGFHTFGFEWLPDEVRWYADDVLIHEEAGSHVAKLVRPQQLILSLWASRQLDGWVGEFDPSRGPWSLDVACVAYSPAYLGAPLCS